MPTAIIIMAAGASSRMGCPKQALAFGGSTLLGHAAETALSSRAASVSVVLGASENVIGAELAGLPVRIVPNPNWAAGIGSTIHAGVAQAQTDPNISSVILAVADQPHLTAETYNRIIAAHLSSGLPIIASQYSGTVGVPALFERRFFDSLLALPPDQGCKGLILSNAAKSMRLPCPEAAIDIDSPEDYSNLLRSIR